MPATTTIKVSPQLRDRVNAAASRRGQTPASLIDRLIEELERQDRFAAIRAAYARLPAGNDYWAETAEWDTATVGDGLTEDPGGA